MKKSGLRNGFGKIHQSKKARNFTAIMKSKKVTTDVAKIFEGRGQPLISKNKFYGRVFSYFWFSVIILGFSLSIGTVGYAYFGELGFVDAFYNASMILTGMGPVNDMDTNAGKIFASLYALFSGIAFLSMVAVFMAPFLHRFLHSINLDPDAEKNIEEGED